MWLSTRNRRGGRVRTGSRPTTICRRASVCLQPGDVGEEITTNFQRMPSLSPAAMCVPTTGAAVTPSIVRFGIFCARADIVSRSNCRSAWKAGYAIAAIVCLDIDACWRPTMLLETRAVRPSARIVGACTSTSY